jgi:hypothetical protein
MSRWFLAVNTVPEELERFVKNLIIDETNV